MTWRLRENVRWHDGEPFTSADVCFTWKFVTSPNSQVYNRDQYLGIIGCDAPDDHTVVFRWNGVYGYYDGLFEAVLPEHVLGGMTTEQIVNYEPFNRGPAAVGTGPFKFAEWKSGEYIRVVRNDDYWRGPEYPRIDEIVWAFIPDPNTRLNAMRAGQHHYAQLLPTQVSEVRGLDGYQVHLVSSNTFLHLDLSVNTERARRLFSDPSVREALFHAVDRRAIADKLMQGTVRVADSPINPSSPYHDPDVPTVSFDPGLTGRMLADAGWLPGPDGIRVRDGERFSFTMLNRAGSTDRIAVAQVIQAELRDVGVEVTLRDAGERRMDAALAERAVGGDRQRLVPPGRPQRHGAVRLRRSQQHDRDVRPRARRAHGGVGPPPRSGRAQATARQRAGQARRNGTLAAALLQRDPAAGEHPRGWVPAERHELRELLEPVGVDAAVAMGAWPASRCRAPVRPRLSPWSMQNRDARRLTPLPGGSDGNAVAIFQVGSGVYSFAFAGRIHPGSSRDHMRGKGLLLVGTLLAANGCYTYLSTPLEEVAPGTPVRIRLTAAEAGRLVEQRLTEDRLLTGTLVEQDDGQVLVDTSVGHNDAERGMRAVVQRLSVPTHEVLEIEQRHLDKGRTGVVVGVGAVAAGVIIALQARGGGGSADNTGGGTQESRRVPILSFRVFP